MQIIMKKKRTCCFLSSVFCMKHTRARGNTEKGIHLDHVLFIINTHDDLFLFLPFCWMDLGVDGASWSSESEVTELQLLLQLLFSKRTSVA